MKKPALHGAPAFVLAALLCLAQPCLGQDGPVFPGFEPSDPPPAPVVSEEPASPPPIEEPPVAGLPVEEEPAIEEEVALPVDDSITPLDESGHPMRGPDTQRPLRLPAPPPVPAAPEFDPQQLELNGSSTEEGPSLGEDSQGQPGDAEPAKKNLWKRSTDALRDLTKPKTEKASPAEEDAARSWQKLRRQTMPQQHSQPQETQQVTQPGQQRQMPQGGGQQKTLPQNSVQRQLQLQQQQLQQRQLQQQQLQQRQMQQRMMQQRQLEQKQLEQRQMQQRQMQQRQMQQRQSQQGQSQQGQIQPRYGQPNGANASGTSPYGNQAYQSQPQSSRRQVQRPVSQPSAGQQRSAVPPTSRSRQSSQPREAKNDPRSPWERS